MNRCVLVFFLVVGGLWIPVPAAAQESPCDPHLEGPRDHPFGYRLLDDRCEGLYVQKVAGTTLRIASLTEFFEDYDLSAGPLLIEWEPLGADAIRLRAQGLRHRLYYRMDSVQPMEAASYAWTPNILAALQITRQDLGVVGWTRLPVGTTERFVYVPLRIRQHQEVARGGTYQLVLVPGRELDRVYVTLGQVDEDGHPASFIRDAEELGYGYYPAGRGITIPITKLETPGIYYLQVGATLRGGGSTTLELWFFHPGT